MSRVIADRVRESSTTIGTDDMALDGAFTGYRAFDDVMADGDTCYYCIQPFVGDEWEIGLGTYDADENVLQRTTVIDSSHANNTHVPFQPGTKNVSMTPLASRTMQKSGALTPTRIPYVDSNGELTDTAELTWDNTNHRIGVSVEDAVTAAVTDVFHMGHNSTGTPAIGFGIGTLWNLESNTTANRNAARMDVSWTTAADASRTAEIVFSVALNGVITEVVALGNDGSSQFGVHVAGILTTSNGATLTRETSETASVEPILKVVHNSSGTPTVGFGAGINLYAETSTTAGTDIAYFEASWAVATHASRASKLVLKTFYITTAHEGITQLSTSNGVRVGFGGVSTPTAFAHCAPSTATAASFRIETGTAPSSPNDGDGWNDSTQKAEVRFLAGIKQAVVGCIFTQTADVTVSNTTTETTLVGTGIGTTTLPANFWTVGKTVRVRAEGSYSTAAVPGSVRPRIYYGSTSLLTVSFTPTGSVGACRWVWDGTITCRSVGASGTVMSQGELTLFTAVTTATLAQQVTTATTTIDTTASNALDVRWKWNTADAANIFICNHISMEVLN